MQERYILVSYITSVSSGSEVIFEDFSNAVFCIDTPIKGFELLEHINEYIQKLEGKNTYFTIISISYL